MYITGLPRSLDPVKSPPLLLYNVYTVAYIFQSTSLLVFPYLQLERPALASLLGCCRSVRPTPQAPPLSCCQLRPPHREGVEDCLAYKVAAPCPRRCATTSALVYRRENPSVKLNFCRLLNYAVLWLKEHPWWLWVRWSRVEKLLLCCWHPGRLVTLKS